MLDFSSAYYLTQLHVVPFSGSVATIHVDDFYQLQDSGAGTYPLVLKVDSLHLCVYPDSAMPSGTLAIPRRWFGALSAQSEDKRRRVFIAKPRTVRQLVQQSLIDPDFENEF